MQPNSSDITDSEQGDGEQRAPARAIDPDKKYNYLSGEVVTMFADKRGLSKQDAVKALGELLKSSKITQNMTIDEFERVAEVIYPLQFRPCSDRTF